MTGSLAQLISLVSYGNEYLKSDVLPENYYLENSVFEFCNSITFTKIHKPLFKSKSVMVASDPLKWFEFLKAGGCKKLELFFKEDGSLEKDYMLAGLVGGGGFWIIQAIYDTHADYWLNSWTVTNKGAKDRKIWGITYTSIDKQPIVSTSFNLEDIKEEFSRCLSNTADFAYKINRLGYVDIFENAKNNLYNTEQVAKDHYRDFIIQSNYSITARQLLNSAKIAWVFGGMGSWSDMWIGNGEERKIYEDLSKKLYDVINRSIAAAINS